MLKLRRILVGGLLFAVASGWLSACGQKGALFLPDTPPGTQRATLPETLNPMGSTAAPAPTANASSPR